MFLYYLIPFSNCIAFTYHSCTTSCANSWIKFGLWRLCCSKYLSARMPRLSAKDLTDLVIFNSSLVEKATFNEYCIALICLRSISYIWTSLPHYLLSYHQAVFPYIMQKVHLTLQSPQIFLFHEIWSLVLVLVRPAILIVLTVGRNGFVDLTNCYFTTEIIQVTP